MKVLRFGKLIDGTGNRPIENATIVIDGTKIIAVGEETAIDKPKGDIEEIDCSKMTAIPGLIDTHLHFALGAGSSYDEMFQWPDSLQLASGIVNAQFTLESGVTTARDCGARNRVALDLREAERRKLILAPRLLVCGRSITMTGGHFHFCNAEADGYEGIRIATRQLLKEGVDFIKIMASGGGTKGTVRERASYTTEELRGAVEEAHRQGKTVTTHCHATEAVANAVEAGVDIMEHCTFLEPNGKGLRHEFREDLAREMVEKGIYADNVLIAMADPSRQEWCFDNFRRFRKLGVKIIAGTDGLGLYRTAGLAFVLGMMVRGGATPMESIISATRMSAEASGIGDVVGTLEAGKEADLVAVEGDPLEDIRVLRNPKLVMKGGAVIPPSGRQEAKVEGDRLAEKVLAILDELGI